jgi:tryptophanyl-tRNA synthetase
MTADIILYKADVIPVGEDQLPHLELAREIVRRFNRLYGPTFPEPQGKLTETRLIVGLDGKEKMSKSLDNHVELAASPEETRLRIRAAFTDPERIRRTDPGRPGVCNVYTLHKQFNPDQLEDLHQQCTGATRGCVDCKDILSDGVNSYFEEFRERRREFASRRGYVDEILIQGADRASAIARETIREVREKMGIIGNPPLR